MKNKLFTILCTCLIVVSCGPIKQIPVETVINYKDSTIVNTIDSVIYIPKERIVDVVAAYDTLKLETNMAKAEAYVDTTLHLLKGSIENKKGVQYKYIYKDKIQVKDSIITKEVPVPVEVVKEVKTHYWYERLLWILSLVGVFYLIQIGVRLYGKIKGKI